MKWEKGLYISLFHGRHTPDEELEGWGFRGPVIGPVKISWTYGTVHIYDPNSTDMEFLYQHDDMISFDGKYYGDFSIVQEDELDDSFSHSTDYRRPLLSFDEAASIIRRDHPNAVKR